MLYLLEINLLVAAVVFGIAGLLILAVFAWTEAKRYAQALHAMQRITAAARRERLAISRMNSQIRNFAHNYFGD